MLEKEVYEKYVKDRNATETPAEISDFEKRNAFEKAWVIFEYAYYAEDATMTDLAALLNHWISLTPTTEEMLQIWDQDEIENEERLGDAVLTWEKTARLALDKARSKENAWNVLMSRYCEVHSQEFLAAFEKFLEFCKYKEDVEWLMGQVCNWLSHCGKLDYEKYFLKIFQRGRELPRRPKKFNGEIDMDIDDID